MLMPNVAMHPLVSRRGLDPDDLGRRALDGSSRRALLLVAPDTAVLSDNALLLANSDYCVVIAFSDGEVLALHDETSIAFAILSASLGNRGLRASAEAVRRRWPLAQILILSPSAFGLEDHLYDERIDPSPEPKQLLDTLDRLSKKPWSQSASTADLNAWHMGASFFRSSIRESDPTKASAFEPAKTEHLRGKQPDVRSWQL
jgi:hypothetical protein